MQQDDQRRPQHAPTSIDEKLRKHRPSRLPWLAIQALSELTERGARKHGEHLPWELENAAETYREALLRHALAWAGGEELDEEGTPHALAIAFNALALEEVKRRG